jgi:hypothetical protein
MNSTDVRAERSADASTANSSSAAAPVDPRVALLADAATRPPALQSSWAYVMCFVGANYFSTLSYQPTIAFEAMGLLAPLATIVLVALTLFGALPVLRRIAHKSPHGQGAIGLNEQLLGGWLGKSLVLVLLGFAATDFVITKTLSAADAAEHLIHNPLFADAPAALQNQMFLTMALLVLLGAISLRGFRELIIVAVVLVGVYLSLNLVIIVSGLWHLATHPGIFTAWYENVMAGRWYLEHAPVAGQGVLSTVLICLLLFPKLALGLSGLEVGIAAMPRVRGDKNDGAVKPEGRIRNTQKLLTTAALIMSVMLLGSSVVTSLLIHPDALRSGGPAANRALAFIAHGETAGRINPLFGALFGTIYDISTVAILWFAGASAMSALLNLAPRYFSRYGVTPKRGESIGILVLALTGISLFVTWVFDASVEAQAGALTTAVLVLICNTCLAVTIVDWNRRRGPWYVRFSWRYFAVMLIFIYMTIAVIIQEPEGLTIAAAFIVSALVCSMISRRNAEPALR